MKAPDRCQPGWSPYEQQIIRQIRDDPVPAVPQAQIAAVCQTAAAFHPKNDLTGRRGFWRVVLACFGDEMALFWGLCTLC